jgi:4-hydroxymandelate oxidase
VSDEARWLESLEERARDAVPAPVLEYVLQGARGSLTTGEAVAAWRDIRFRPRVLHDVTHVDPGVAVLGHRLGVPWGVAPTTLQRAVHPEGELAMARATAEAGSLMVLSSNAGTPFAEIGATGVHWWLQAYLPADRTLAEPMLERAVAAGAQAVVLTVDTPVVGTKYATPGTAVVWDTVAPELFRANADPDHDEQPGAEKALDLGPHDIGWLADRTGLPVVVKGVLRPADAVRSVQAGASAVWVSNHGGRQLDRAASTASCLPDVAEAVGERAQVYVDGGLRSGLDVLAALALGADAVFLGRSPLLALVDGADGVARLHRELRLQTVEALRLAGCRTPADTRGLAVPAGTSRP